MAGARREPLAVLELVVGAIFALLVVVFGAVGFGMLASRASPPGVNTEMCVSTAPGGTVGFRQDGDPALGPPGLADGITWRAEMIQICEPDPDGSTAVLGVVGLLVWAGAPLVFFGLLWRVVFFASEDLPWLLVLLGIAFLALHRVIGEAVVLREDSEATI